MKEIDIQRLLCDAGNAMGGHCFKCSNRFLKGVSDLSVQLPGHHHVYLEVKFNQRFKRGMRVTFDLTMHQRDFILKHRNSGGRAGWLMVVSDKAGRYLLDCSTFPPSMHVRDLIFDPGYWFAKERGEPWPIEKIVNIIESAHPREFPELGAAPRRGLNRSSTQTPINTEKAVPVLSRPSRGSTRGRPGQW